MLPPMMPIALSVLTAVLSVTSPASVELVVPALRGVDSPSPAQDTTRSCALAGAATTLSLTEETGCGGSAAVCTSTQEISVSVGGAEVLDLDRVREEGEAPLPSFRLRCRPDRLEIALGEGPPLVFVPGAGKTLHASAATMDEATRLEGPSPLTPRDRARVAALWQLVKGPGFHLDAHYRQAVGLAMAQDAVESNRFTVADDILPTLEGDPRRAALSAALEQRRKDTQPYRVAEGTRIGTVPRVSPERLEQEENDDDVPPRMFWQGRAFCVLQEDGDAPSQMRCYDVTKHAWGKRKPVPKGIPLLPSVANSVRFSVCTKDRKTCLSCYAFDVALKNDARLGITDGKIWLARGVDDSVNASLEPLTADQASGWVAKSTGSPYFGHARFTFAEGDHAGDAFEIGQPEKTWHLLPPPPNGSHWTTASVSPDQGFVAALAEPVEGADNGTLFVFKLVPAGH